MGWDSHTNIVIGSEEVWTNAIAVSVICVHNNFNVVELLFYLNKYYMCLTHYICLLIAQP